MLIKHCVCSLIVNPAETIILVAVNAHVQLLSALLVGMGIVKVLTVLLLLIDTAYRSGTLTVFLSVLFVIYIYTYIHTYTYMYEIYISMID